MLDITKPAHTAPFDTARLDRLMDDAGIDVLLATSKHNVQYLMGGHRAFFFESMDAMGLSRYLPVFVYARGQPQKAGFFGHRMENFQNEVKPFWVSELNVKSSGSVDAMEKAVDYVRKLSASPKRIGIEIAFLPVDAATVLRKAFPNSEFVDVSEPVTAVPNQPMSGERKAKKPPAPAAQVPSVIVWPDMSIT